MSRTAVLMDKGIIIGVEHETAIRSNLPFVMFRHAASVSSSPTGVDLLSDKAIRSPIYSYSIYCNTI